MYPVFLRAGPGHLDLQFAQIRQLSAEPPHPHRSSNLKARCDLLFAVKQSNNVACFLPCFPSSIPVSMTVSVGMPHRCGIRTLSLSLRAAQNRAQKPGVDSR